MAQKQTAEARREARRLARENARAARRRRQIARRLDWRTDVTQLMMGIDRTIQAFWPLGAVALLFLALTYAGVWGAASDMVRGGLTGALGLAAIAAFLRGVWVWRWPSSVEARARLDQGRRDRPVASFDETMVLGRGDAAAGALWEAHQRQVAEKAATVRAPMAQLDVGGRRDPWATRFLAALLLGGGLLLSPPGDHFADWLRPYGAAASVPSGEDAVEIWAVPPDYTGLPPVYFDAETRQGGVARLPLGSTVYLSAFVEGAEPALSITPRLAETPLQPSADGGFSAEIVIDRSRRIEFVARAADVRPTIDLKIEPWPDRPPRVEMVAPPQRAGDGRLGLTYAAVDDYGVVRAWVVIALDEDALVGGYAPDAAEPQIIEVAAPRGGGYVEGGGPPDLSNATVVDVDVADHPWSGLPVVVSLRVEDAIGQTDETRAAVVTMPDLLISEPMAKALVEQRRLMIWNIDAAARATRTLYAASEIPEEYFLGSTIFLLIESALHDLSRGLTLDAVADVRDVALHKLWRAALRLEELGRDNPPGRLDRAERRLREALERDDITDQELAELMAELRAAIEEYIAFLMQLAATNPELAERLAEEFGGGGEGESLGRSQLDELLDQLEDAARDGERQQAEDMLTALEDLLENLRPNQGQPSADGFGSQNQTESEEGGEPDVDEQMRDIIEEQQRLAEEGFDEYLRERQGDSAEQEQGQQSEGRQSQGQQNQGQQDQAQQNGGQPDQGRQNGEQGEENAGAPDNGSNGPADLAERQRELRDALGALRRRLDEELPEELDDADAAERRRRAEGALERAEEGMDEAERRLREGDTRGAAREQMEVIEELREGFREFDRRLAERDGESDEERAFREPGDDLEDQGRPDQRTDQRPDNRSLDPLGRPLGPDSPGRGANGEDFEGDLGGFRTSREVMEELQRRLQDPDRPAEERDYIDRLLRDPF